MVFSSCQDWLVFRQGGEGGFQGRTNKLVDGCYSFWQGGVSALIQRLHSIVDEQLGLSDGLGDCCSDSIDSDETSGLFDGEQCLEGLSSHVDDASHHCPEGQQNASDLRNPSSNGYNFIRGRANMKPLFNSMNLQQYLLLCSQVEGGFRDKPGKNKDHYHTCYCLSGLSVSQYSWSEDVDSPPLSWAVMGPYSNLLEPVHPLYNIVLSRYYEAHEFFLDHRHISHAEVSSGTYVSCTM
ncbi:unnamed protein product [Ilex paraguariensis]|uniref:Prenyltransferase alpha-alpha toroid domain-containing protein n=1 Tax=Ilex paraguariensis TaxID=185542 RepID=A0ABC8SVX4_9AQUA